jgi:clan AA aspartic protease (TIGR02281 family)
MHADLNPDDQSTAAWLFRGALVVLLLAVPLAPGISQAPIGCKIGQPVADTHSSTAVIVGGHNDLCLIRYKDGQTQRWVGVKELSIIAPAATPPLIDPAATNQAMTEGVTIVRPTIINRLVYRADPLGHIVLTAKVNGTPVSFLVDTGATLVSLSPRDASAAGLKRDALTFNQTVHTSNGPAKAAFSQIREIRIEQFGLDNVQVAVIDSLKQSVLGMSFLRRLKAFEMRDGELSMTW